MSDKKINENYTAKDALETFMEKERERKKEEQRIKEEKKIQEKESKNFFFELLEEYRNNREQYKLVESERIAEKVFNVCVDEIENNGEFRKSMLKRIQEEGDKPITLVHKEPLVCFCGYGVGDMIGKSKIWDARKLSDGYYASPEWIAKNFSKKGPFYHDVKHAQFKDYQIVGKAGWQLFPFVRDFNVKLQRKSFWSRLRF